MLVFFVDMHTNNKKIDLKIRKVNLNKKYLNLRVL